ncbi:hypothetical protein [Hoeflea prorocentri]|uniref:Lipoprotein n=1 Tax=Hoeflea prorocentri TaxID=1922333 RepID=A0A9X3ZIE4_9HYPH|nr:hypothetical protein [Hoeflea prorocentri]MCY6381645.1 hypothetical protein [Hoeflea prorocentri]MDA5399445.1 hypothetical protein [Hoeflea prorocentri]
MNKIRIVMFAGIAALVAGCNSGGVGGLKLGQNSQGAGSEQGGSVDQTLGKRVVQGTCPKIELRDGTAYFRKYERGGEDDPTKIQYQAAIADTTRQCSITGDQMTINVVAAGRAAAGPAGKAGPIKMPIRVAVVEKGTNKVLYSELTEFETALPQGTPTTQFLFSKPDVSIPITASRSVRVFIGFDEGPQGRG